MAKRTKTLERKRERIDGELALTADLLATAETIAIRCGWRVALRALYYVVMRISSERGRRQLAEYLSDQNIAW